MIFVFDSYVLDTGRRELRRGHTLVSVQPQVFDLLEYLIRNRGRVISRDDLLDAIWGGRIVSESTLATRINAARSAIGDDGESQRLIRTLPRKGIRFVGEVREVEEEEEQPRARRAAASRAVATAADLDAWDMGIAQSTDRVRVIGILNILGPDDPETKARRTVFEQTLQQLGWKVGRNLKIETRDIGSRDLDRARRDAAELVALAPDVLFCTGSVSVAPLQRATHAIPIVFMNVPDPVGAGFVQSMAHPGANITGFSNFEYSIGGKWAELLKQIAPNAARALVLRDTSTPGGIGQFAAVRSAAQSFGIELTPAGVRDIDEIELNVAAFARSGHGGVIVTSVGTGVIRKLIINLVDRYKLPTVYPYPYFAADGGLNAYGPNASEQVRRAAGYIDRILRGEKPADLPVQAPTKYELVVNLKTAKALGITIPQSLLVTADEVIE